MRKFENLYMEEKWLDGLQPSHRIFCNYNYSKLRLFLLKAFSFQNHTMLFYYLSNHDNSKLWRLFEKVLPELSSSKTALKKLLEWPVTASFIKLSCKLISIVD